MAFTFSFKDAVLKQLPRWLLKGEGGAVAQSLATVKDEFIERARTALELRFPTRAQNIEGALEKIGFERGIPRGRSETAAHFVDRVIRWRYPLGHRVRGNAIALLEQVSEYWGGMFVQTIDNNQTLWQRYPDGTENYELSTGFSWDGQVTQWSRFWLFMYPNPEFPEIKKWPKVLHAWGNTLKSGHGHTLGQQGVSPDDVKAIKRLFKETRQATPWKPAGTMIPFAVLVFGTHSPPDGFFFTDPASQWGNLYGRAAAPSTVRFWAIQQKSTT